MSSLRPKGEPRLSPEAPASPEREPFEPRTRRARLLILAAVILLPQLALFWPSITGRKVLLPLDVLGTRAVWIAPGEPGHVDRPSDEMLSDLVLVTELNRRYTAEAVRGGRLPLWTPWIYCGAPYFAANHPAVFSPFRLVDYAWPGPEAIAWSQLLKSLFAGLGAYLFFRRVLRASFPAAVVGAGAFPLCGYMILWQGFSLSQVAAYLPWALLATDAAVRAPFRGGSIGLALVTTALMVSGHAANAGHVLIATGAYAAWLVFDLHGARGACARAGIAAAGSVSVAWLAGFALSAPQLLPTLEYMQSSVRIASRAQGHVEMPAMGVAALWQVVLPYTFGAYEKEGLSLLPVPRSESSAAAYAGLVALAVFVPLAFGDARRRPLAIFLAALGFFALVPLLGVPLLSSVFTWPPLSLLRNNRFALVTAFSIAALAVIGLDQVARGRVRARAWHWAPIGLCALAGVWCVLRLADPPVAREATIQLAWFRRVDRLALLAAAAGGACWWLVRSTPGSRLGGPRVACLGGALWLAEVTAMSWGVCPQCDRSLDYPRLPVLTEIVRRGGGRTLGANCLPPNLLMSQGLPDVRGYDAADPVRIVELLRAQRHPDSPEEYSYAVTLTHVPKHPSPISDLLALRWIVIPGLPPEGYTAAFTLGGSSAIENTSALPRVTVPERVEVEPDKARRLARLGADDFRPRELALVETTTPLDLPPRASGTARIVIDEPERVVIELDLSTRALVRLADSYERGWRATVDGQETPVLVTDHALRGVVAPAGARTLEFRYEPTSFRIGLWIGALALGSICAWAFALRRRAT